MVDLIKYEIYYELINKTLIIKHEKQNNNSL